MWRALLVLGFVAWAGWAEAAPRDALVVTPSWLAAHAHDKDLVILHAGNAKSYAKGHIAGARLAELGDVTVSDPQGLSTELPPADLLRQKLEALGISDHSRIVVYSDSGTIPRATRILLTLDAAGFGARSSLLDGGLKAWKDQGHAITTGNADPAPGHLEPLTLKRPIVDADFVKAHLKAPGTVVIDARAPEFYRGEKPSMGGRGHIPGARNIPFTTVTDASGKLKPARELRLMFAHAGYKPGDHVIAYCHVGIQATAVVFAARTLGIDARLYDGSFQDWVKRGLPTETGAN